MTFPRGHSGAILKGPIAETMEGARHESANQHEEVQSESLCRSLYDAAICRSVRPRTSAARIDKTPRFANQWLRLLSRHAHERRPCHGRNRAAALHSLRLA